MESEPLEATLAIPDKVTTPKLSSYEVFMSFVSLEGGKVDVERIFSKECLDRWLSTRQNTIKHPQDSFQRVLYAHIRGVDQRKPFPKQVETELLFLLRNGNPWNNLLSLLNKKTHRRRFAQLGFHEMQSGKFPPRKKQKRKKRERAKENVLVRRKSVQKTVIVRPQVFLPTNESYYERFCSALETTYPAAIRDSIFKVAKSYGYDFNSPAIQYMCSLTTHHPLDLRFNRDFILPDIPLEFSKQAPIFLMVLSKTWVIEYVNPVVEAMMGASVVGKHIFDLSPGITAEVFMSAHRIPRLFKQGSIWMRALVQMPDGTFQVVHGKTTIIGTPPDSYKYIYQFQPAHHLYPGLQMNILL